MKSVYVVCVYRKSDNLLVLKAEYGPEQMKQYEDAVAGLDCATDYYYDVEVMRVAA